MAIQAQNTAAPFGAVLALRGSHAVEAITTRYAQWRTAQQTINELHSLSDLELNDLGISRGEIHDIAWSAVQK